MEVYRWICGLKLSFTATRKRSHKTWFPTVYPTIHLQKWKFEYGYPHSNALLQFHLKLERCKPHKVAHHPTKCDIIDNVKLFLTVYHRIYCHKFLTLSNQTKRYKSKCITIWQIVKLDWPLNTNKAHVLINKYFQRKIVNIFLTIIFSIYFGSSKESSHWDGSFEYPQHIFWLRNKKIIFLIPTRPDKNE